MKSNSGGKAVRYNKWGYIFLIPFIVVFVIFQLVPLVNTIYNSFFENYMSGLTQVGPTFVGLDNYKALFSGGDIWTYFKNTMVLWIMCFIPQIFLSLLLGAWFSDVRLKLKGSRFFKTVIYLPNLIMASAFSMLFFTLFSDGGPINSLLMQIGFISEPYKFLSHAGSARGLIAMMNCLMWFGNTTILLMAGMMGIDTSLFEAAEVDGATSTQVFFKITLPLLRPILVYVIMATYADAMAAIKKLVFDDKKYTLKQLNEGLKADFVGYEQMQADCLAAPKYGNDDDYVDLIAADLINFTEMEHRKYKTLYSVLSHGTLSISNNTPFGQMTGASAGGRKAWTPLSDGISPTQGADVNGPTAIIKSVAKLSNDNMNIGMVHNFKLMAGLLDTPEGENGIITLLRTACAFGNGEMQFNYMDNNTLLEAQKHPEQYKDLVVRVAGYSAFFTELCKDVQDEIISRTTLTKF